MNPDKLKVVSVSRVDTGSQYAIECTMSDGSVWTCDVKGDNWEKIVMSPDELTQLFKKTALPTVKENFKREIPPGEIRKAKL